MIYSYDKQQAMPCKICASLRRIYESSYESERRHSRLILTLRLQQGSSIDIYIGRILRMRSPTKLLLETILCALALCAVGVSVIITPVAAADMSCDSVFPIATNLQLNGQFNARAAAFDGTNYLIALQIVHPDTSTEPVAQLISPLGTPVGPLIHTGRTGDPPRVAFDGTNYLLVWADYSAFPTSLPIYGVLIDRSGNAIGTPLQLSQSTTVESLDSVTFGRGTYLITWTDNRRFAFGGDRDIYERRVSTTPAPLGSDIKVSGSGGAASVVGFDGNNFFIVWRDDVGDDAICGRFLSPAGIFTTGEFFVDSDGLQSDNPSAVAFDGAKYMVIFNGEVSPGNWDLFARFVTTAGGVLTRVGIATNAGPQRFPSVAFNGANYLVTWNDTEVKARLFNSSGSARSSEFTLFSSPTYAPLLFDGRRFLAMTESGNVLTNEDGSFAGLTNATIYGMFFSRPRLDIPGPYSDNAFPLRFCGFPGMTSIIQRTTNLLSVNTVWTTLITTNPPDGTFNFTDTNAVPSRRSFYRAFQQ
jgi:hypothetical protein